MTTNANSAMAQYRQQQMQALNTQLDTAVTYGDTAEARKISGQIAQLAGTPLPKFAAADVRAAILKIAPEAATSLRLITALNAVSQSVANNPDLINAHDTAESLALEMLESAGWEGADDDAGDDADAGSNPNDDNGSQRRSRKPARQHREEPQLGAGRPTGGKRHSNAYADLPSASRATFERLERGPMQGVAKAAAAGDKQAKAYMEKAKTDFATTEHARLRQLRQIRR
ncbi:hypothetical protein [Bradyrhizobium liaoningense]|uniref:hypothetical protein n=1 Tax=Bradyrhizobium liaoningense TaxID=43992 RepID=UPI001BA5FC01|nr:hypothetical protein [Bradyrhizobium liaoningense]MBR0712689.1 hypothetical protein [Bradyrhizobium liaoningense]